MASEGMQKFIKMNQEIRSRISAGKIRDPRVVTSATADTVFGNNLSRESRALITNNSIPVFEQLYAIPEIAICVDFWNANLGTRTFMLTSENEAFVVALNKYLREYEQIPGQTFLTMFNSNAKDYIFHGNEIFFVDTRLTEVDGFKFPKKIISIPWSDAAVECEVTFANGPEYVVEYLDAEIDNKKIIFCKRAAKAMDKYGVSLIERAIRPVASQITDSELDSSVSKMGVLSSFVLVKYGTDDNPRTDSDIEELHTELQANMEQGIAFGVVPPDVNVESLFKSSNASSFNRDKIYETYVDAIDTAFGGVINTVKPGSNTGAGGDKSLVMLRNLVNYERDSRKNQIVSQIVRRAIKLNGIEESVSVQLTDIDLLIESIQDSRLKEYDRGAMSTETYLEDKFESELSKIKKESEDYRELIVPRDLPYTKTQNSTPTEESKK
jgi:hypothetical protein